MAVVSVVTQHRESELDTFHSDTTQGGSTLISAIPMDWADSWLFRLFVNLTGYATVIIPGYLLILYVKKTGYLDRAGAYFFYFQFV